MTTMKKKLTYLVSNGEGNHIGVITNFDMEQSDLGHYTLVEFYNTTVQMITDHYGLDKPLVKLKKIPDVNGIFSFTYSDAADGYDFTSKGILVLEEIVIYP